MTTANFTDRLSVKKMNVAINLSRETTAFTADIYLDGRKIGKAINDGNGGATNCWIENDLIVANYGHIIETWIDARAADAENAKRGLLASRKNEKWIQKQLQQNRYVFTTGNEIMAHSDFVVPMQSDELEAERNYCINKIKLVYPDAKDFRFPECLV